MTRSNTLMVTNCSSSGMNGTLTHTSGEGTGALQDGPFTISLNAFTSDTTNFSIRTRNNHDDYWIWAPSSGPSIKMQKNLDKSLGACVLLTDDLLVVVTSDHGVADTKLPAQAAVAAS